MASFTGRPNKINNHKLVLRKSSLEDKRAVVDPKVGFNKKLDLNNVTLVILDCISVDRGLFAVKESLNLINVYETLFFTSLSLQDKLVNTIKIKECKSRFDYSKFILSELYNFVNTDFVLIIQYDGYVVNPKVWTNKFFEFDYIGAPWLDKVVGNGGFSLRSRNLLRVTQSNYDIIFKHSRSKGEFEDDDICRCNRELLCSNGIKIADYDTARIFSVELEEPYTNQFGWHGMQHVPSCVISRNPYLAKIYRINNTKTKRYNKNWKFYR